MEILGGFIALIIVSALIGFAIRYAKNRKSKKTNGAVVASKSSKQRPKQQIESEKPKAEKEVHYTKTNAMSEYECKIFERIQTAVNQKYFVFPQVNLASIVDKETSTRYRSELFRNIDFGVFDKTTSEPLVLIELNDKTHKQASRYSRDLKVREILEKANIPLINLYTGYENATEYIAKRLSEFITL